MSIGVQWIRLANNNDDSYYLLYDLEHLTLVSGTSRGMGRILKQIVGIIR